VAEGRAQGLPERIVGSRIENSTEPIGLTRAGAFFYYTQSWDFQIHLMEIDPVSRTLKPSRVLNANSPDWSPDGRYLAYAQYPQEGLISIRTLATGEERTLWTGLTDFIMSLRWFPDQRSLATQGFGPEGGGGSVGLRRIDLTSGSLSNILVGQNWREFGANPTFSPDGRLVTYKAWDPVRKVSILTRYNLETRGREVLLERKPPQYVAAFSVLAGTGHIAVVLQEGDGTSSIQLVDPASREPRSVYRTSRGNFIPASILLDWMPDGKSLLFVTSPHSSRTWDSDMVPPCSLFRIPVSGGQPEKLFEAEWIWQVRVHPNGSQVAIETRPPRTETWVVNNLFAAKKR
jgi:Tol biopolymer transport system component